MNEKENERHENGRYGPMRKSFVVRRYWHAGSERAGDGEGDVNMPKKYETPRKSKHTPMRQKLFTSLQMQEVRHKHNIPPKAFGKSLNKHSLHVREKGETKKHTFYTIKDKQGRLHGEVKINKKSKKIDWWRVQ